MSAKGASVGGGALKWLQKAGDLLEQLDKTAAETIAAGDDQDEEVARLLGLDGVEGEVVGGWDDEDTTTGVAGRQEGEGGEAKEELAAKRRPEER